MHQTQRLNDLKVSALEASNQDLKNQLEEVKNSYADL